VKILVTVANIQIKNLKVEVEKGFRRTLFEPELVDPNMEVNSDNWPKGGDSLLHKSNFRHTTHRKGNNLNYIILVEKESRATYDVD